MKELNLDIMESVLDRDQSIEVSRRSSTIRKYQTSADIMILQIIYCLKERELTLQKVKLMIFQSQE
jgi:DNA-binding transcriptional MerR regulator